MYWKIELTNQSKLKLKALLRETEIKEVFNTYDWVVYCEHITVAHPASHKALFETVSNLLTSFEGHTVSFKINKIGISENAIAVGVTTPTLNKQSHITVAVRKGHQPKESNDITDWKEVWCLENFEGKLTKSE